VTARQTVKSQVRAALLVIVPAIFVAILAPRGSLLQGIALVVLVVAAVYLVGVLLRARGER
jgi:hypothetical protein